MLLRFAAAFALVLVATACSLLRDLDDLVGGTVAPSKDYDDACTRDAECLTGHCSADTGRCRCPPEMTGVQLPSTKYYCIDNQEVAQADYAAFADTCSSPACLASIARCGSNGDAYQEATSCLPAAFGTTDPYDPAIGELPAVCVDWCDAYAYCKSRNKHLCGQIGGKSSEGGLLNPHGEFNNRQKSEWFFACVQGTTTASYPYAGPFDPARCNGCARGGTPDCTYLCDGSFGCAPDAPCPNGPVSVYAEICYGEEYFWVQHMSGNVAEWDHSCKDDLCHVRGGAWVSGEAGLRCAATSSCDPGTYSPLVGFRCCRAW
jgi:hypothetical protein